MESMPSAMPNLADDPALGLSRRTKFEILFAILLGLFLSALDQTIVGPVLPRIVTELHGQDLYTWVVTIFLLTYILPKFEPLFRRRAAREHRHV